MQLINTLKSFFKTHEHTYNGAMHHEGGMDFIKCSHPKCQMVYPILHAHSIEVLMYSHPEDYGPHLTKKEFLFKKIEFYQQKITLEKTSPRPIKALIEYWELLNGELKRDMEQLSDVK